MITLLLGAISCATLNAQAKPLPANYKTIFENSDLLVMRVHYGPHEFVPMHDHSAYPTVYVYLNDSGVIRIDHAPPASFSVQRPPTHSGAFRISPSMAERHSITNLSAIPSDFLRVELKTIPLNDLKQAFRSPAPSSSPGAHSEFHDGALRIDRTLCPADSRCSLTSTKARSLLVAITALTLSTPEGNRTLRPGDVAWQPPTASGAPRLSAGAQILRISLLYPEEPQKHPTQP